MKTPPSDYHEQVIERVQRIARFSSSNQDIGVPWSLFEDYITALDAKQIAFAGEVRSSKNRTLAAPVSLNSEHVRHAGVLGTVWVYPVIA